MSISVQELAADPSLYLLTLDPAAAHFQRMSRDDFHRSIFLDKRIAGAAESRFQVPEHIVRQQEWPAPATRPLGIIFHVAHCGSTLLARALDLPGRSLVLREPAALRWLGVNAATQGGVHKGLLRFALSMLGKRWDSRNPVIAKANVPVNFIAEDIMALTPDAPAVLLHFPLSSYIAAVMRTPRHEQWVENIYGEVQLAGSPWAQPNAPGSTAERAACLWFAQMSIFARLLDLNPNSRSLCASNVFERPADTVAAAAAFFGISLDAGEAEVIAGGEIFETYSKNPALDYDLEVRAARELEATRRLAPQIAEAEAWVRLACNEHKLVQALDRPLVGEPVPLLSREG